MLAGTNHASRFASTLGNVDISSNQAVPLLDFKLGANYKHDVYHGELTLDAGWLWVDYFAVIDQNGNDNGNVSFQGLYFGLKWLGNLV